MTDRSGFALELFVRRRTKVLESLGSGAMILPAAPPLLRSGDSELRYRPSSELFYLTGCAEPEAVLVLRGHADSDRCTLFVQERDPDAERWNGPRPGPDHARELYGIDAVHPVAALPERLPGLLLGAEQLHFRLSAGSAGSPVEAAVLRTLRHARAIGAREGRGPRGVVDPGGILDEMRLRKDPEEIHALRTAAQITVASFAEAIAMARPGMGEWELEAAVEAGFRRRGAGAPAFATIVGSGPNGCVLHHVMNDRVIREGELVLLDAGAEVRNYAGDVTRTFPTGGRFSPEQRAAYEVVEAARSGAVAAIRPGVTIQSVHREATRSLVEGLVSLGILEGTVDDLLEREAHRRWFPHRTSHWIGLDTHDPGDYRVNGFDRELEAGMVLTVEPGLYFPSEGDESPSGLPAGFQGIGIRIEDDILVTDEGHEVLSAGLPTDPDAIEEWVGRDL